MARSERSKKNELKKLLQVCSYCKMVDRPFVDYHVYDDWLPEQVNLLFITESPPPGQKSNFFYNLDKKDRLRMNLKNILGLNINEHEIPKWFKDVGFFLTSAIKCRPPRGARSYRDEQLLKKMAKCCTYLLAKEVNFLRPKHIIAWGKIAQISAALIKLKVNHIFPHPNHIVRFKRNLIPAVRKVVTKLGNLQLCKNH